MITKKRGGKVVVVKQRLLSIKIVVLVGIIFALLLLSTRPLLNTTTSSSSGSSYYAFLLFEPTTTTTITRQEEIDFEGIVQKWGLKSPLAVTLLKEQVNNNNHLQQIHYFNKSNDLLAFYHTLKTGGTSLSRILEESFLKMGGFVVPGSKESAYFDMGEFHRKTTQTTTMLSSWQNRPGVVFSHSKTRENKNNNNGGGLLQQLRNSSFVLAQKKVHNIAIVRDPFYWRASHYYESICRVGAWVNQQQKHLGLNKDQCPPMNLTAVQIFRAGNENLQKYDFCGSLDVMFESKFYTNAFHNMYQTKYMGSLPIPPPELHELGSSIIPPDDNNNNTATSTTSTYESVEEYTLRDLGGLIDYDSIYGERFIWFGITERMHESMCLFYFTLKINPILETPRERYKECRPTYFWEEKHKLLIKQRETFDYTIYHTANAILDVRMEAMKLELQAQIDAGVVESLESIPYLAPRCFHLVNNNRTVVYTTIPSRR